jgi:MFS family permease
MVRNVFLIALTYQIILNATRPIITLYASELGASTAAVGMLASVYAFFPLLFSIHIGKMSDRFGIRLPVIVGVAGLAVSMAFPFLFKSLWSLYVSQGLVGVAQIFINVSLQNAMGFAKDKTERDRNFSIFSMGISGGAMVGPIVGGLIGEYSSYSMTFLAATAFGTVPFVIALFLPGVLEGMGGKRKSGNAGMAETFELLKSSDMRRALTTSILVLYSRDIYMAYFPLYAESIGLTAAGIGLVLTIQGAASVAVRGMLPWMSRRWSREIVMFISLLAAGASFLAVPFFEYPYWFWGLAILLGAGLGCGQPLSMSITYDVSPEGRTGEALGLRTAVNRLSQVVAPFLFGLIGTVSGLSPVFYVSGLFLIGGSFLTKKRREGGSNNAANTN